MENCGSVGQVCWDLLTQRGKINGRFLMPSCLRRQVKIFLLERHAEAAACIQDALLPARAGWKGQGIRICRNASSVRDERVSAAQCPPMARQEHRHCPGSGTGVQILGLNCKTSAQAARTAAVRGLGDTVVWNSSLCRLSGARADETCGSSTETDPAEQKQNKAPGGETSTEMGVQNKK